VSEKSLEMRHFRVSPYSKEAELDPIGGNLGPLAPGGARPWPAQAGETACPTMAVNAVERAKFRTPDIPPKALGNSTYLRT
jgi:hypothetical protein